jgi:hypothetical protein
MNGATRAEKIPWFIWYCVLAAFCITMGLYWDISWHETIGRDTFWTPAHLLIQFAAVLAGVYSSYLIFTTTFGRNQAARDTSVNVLGFRAPLGAFVCAWGGAAMLTSAPFDNWWHDAYGLDVKIISPPHALLALGIAALMWGGVLLIVGNMNRVEGALHRQFEWMLLVSGGFIVILSMLFKLEYTNSIFMHSAIFYLASAWALPLFWEAIFIASGWRWARTVMSGIYTAFFLLNLWIFPLFHAEPKLGPVYQNVTHMIPLHFPILILVPAIVLDLLEPKMQSWGKWQQSAIKGIIFVAVLIAVQWPFADFLMSPASRNWIFGTNYFLFFLPPTTKQATHHFAAWEITAAHFWRNIVLAFVVAIVNVRVGIVFGNWLRRLQR